MNTDISQGSVATRLGCGGVFTYDCYKFPIESNSERILKIGQYLVKLWARVRCLVFLTHSVEQRQAKEQQQHFYLLFIFKTRKCSVFTRACFSEQMMANCRSAGAGAEAELASTEKLLHDD